MKKLLAICLSLALLTSLTPAFCEDADYDYDVVPYECAALEATLYLPEGFAVTEETESDTQVNLALRLDGRTDTAFNVNFLFDTAYDGLTMENLPDDILENMITYYQTNYTCEEAPEVYVVDEDYPELDPLYVSGVGADGNYYDIYVVVYDGVSITITGAITGEATEDFMDDTFNLYWQVMEMLLDMTEA